MTSMLPTALLPRALSTAQFQTLAEVPPEIEWFANLTNANTRRVYEQDIEDFMAFTGLRQPEQFREVTRAHVRACHSAAWYVADNRHGRALWLPAPLPMASRLLTGAGGFS